MTWGMNERVNLRWLNFNDCLYGASEIVERHRLKFHLIVNVRLLQIAERLISASRELPNTA
jgi:hypothetical protein